MDYIKETTIGDVVTWESFTGTPEEIARLVRLLKREEVKDIGLKYPEFKHPNFNHATISTNADVIINGTLNPGDPGYKKVMKNIAKEIDKNLKITP